LKDGYGIIWIKHQNHKSWSKQEENVFSKAAMRFYQTMSKAQANYSVSEVGVIVNSELKRKFDEKKRELEHKRSAKFNDDWGFHGTTRESIIEISKTGFLHPDNLNKKNTNTNNSTTDKTKPKSSIEIEVLDDGYYGRGIYFSIYSDYAMFYSEERGSDQILLSKLLNGKEYKCTGRMDGSDVTSGYDSHVSPKGNEVVIFDPSQILPRYVITFTSQEEQEREQEDQ